jgi:homoserine dehydrogenase
VKDRTGVLADITRILADCRISIEALLQKEPIEGENEVNIIILTHCAIEKDVHQALAKMELLESVTGQIVLLRREELH